MAQAVSLNMMHVCVLKGKGCVMRQALVVLVTRGWVSRLDIHTAR